MSGGSFDYLYSKYDQFPVSSYRLIAAEMGAWPDAQAKVLEIAEHLEKAAKLAESLEGVLHDVEWWCSCDYGEDQVSRGVEQWRLKK